MTQKQPDTTQSNGKAPAYRRWRNVSIGAVALAVTVGFIWHTGTGTLSSFGWDAVAAICPLGALEAMLGSRAFVPRAFIALAAVLLVVFVFGRAFCAWVCPVPPLSRFFMSKRARQREREEREQAGAVAREHYEAGTQPSRRPAGVDSRHIVLCGALGTTAIFGFPVFCLVCPVGLCFAIVNGVIRLVGFNEPTWSLVLFVAILVLELVFLRKWCANFCPLGALLSLVSQLNKTFRPSVDASKCLRSTKGGACGVCAEKCPERIDPHSDKGLVPVSECTRCGECAESCPACAITFPFLPKGGEEAQGVAAAGAAAQSKAPMRKVAGSNS